ncbi:T9SS type A sorting domain-containing protein, partial [bacterium]|nr:T9SS type A sorting domain-containing protein [bacterium]
INSLDKDNPEIEYPVFVGLPLGSGMIFVDGGDQRRSLEAYALRTLYQPNYFYNIIPTMMFIQFAGGAECWHNDHNYANLTIDDPNLADMQCGYLNFQSLLTEMEAHDFCTTIGFVPRWYRDSIDEVITLFQNNLDRYSIVQHGNGHDGFEFFAYDSAGCLAVCLERGWCDFPPRPIIEQEADIVEGATRMAEFQQLTGLPYDKAMIFPFGISPAGTFQLLKAYNFLATVNAQSIPIGEEAGQNFDFNIRPINMNYGNFACTYRRHWHQDQLHLFDFFVDRPVLIYEHQDFFESGPGAFNNAAAAINGVSGSAEWRGLGYILKHLYLQKSNDDGTISVMMYTNDLILSNETTSPQIYDIQKEETLNVPILSLTVDDIPTTYSLTDDTLHVTVTIPPGASREIEIRYGSGNKDFAISNEDIQFDPQVSDTLAVTVHNYGSDGGPIPVQFFDGHPDSGGTAMDLVTIERIGPDSSAIIKRALSELVSGTHRLYIILDPHDVIDETNEGNNWATTTVSVPDEFIIDDFEYDDSPLNHGWGIDQGTGELSVVFDPTLNSRVMEAITTEGTGFRISHTAFNSPKKLLSLEMKADEFFILYVRVQTTLGEYYLQYTPDVGADTVSGSYVCFHLGSSYQDSHWHTIQRDLAADVSSQLDASFSWVKYFVLRGSYRLDDLTLSEPITHVGQDQNGAGFTPDGFCLFANYPNPFNSWTTLTYRVSRESDVRLKIYNIRGQRVLTLVDGKKPAGLHRISWDGLDEGGSLVASGVYFCALQVEGVRKIRKMVLLR